MRQRIVPLSRTAEKGLDVDALRSGTLACLLLSLPPPRSMQCTTSSGSSGPTKPRPKPITRLKMPWMQLSIVQGTFSDPAIHWENIRREETNPLGKYLAKRSTGKIFGEKKIHWENIGNLSPEEPGSKIKLHSSVQFDLESGLNFATLKCNQSVRSITILHLKTFQSFWMWDYCFKGRIKYMTAMAVMSMV